MAEDSKQFNSTFKLTPEHCMVTLGAAAKTGLGRGGRLEDVLSLAINFGATFSPPPGVSWPSGLFIAMWFILQNPWVSI